MAAPFRPLPYEKQYASIGRLITVWSHFVTNIEEAITTIEGAKPDGLKATVDRKAMQRFGHFLRIADPVAGGDEFKRLKKAEAAITKAKGMRDALAHGRVVVWSEDFPAPDVQAWNQVGGKTVTYKADLKTMDDYCRLLSQASIDLHLVARRMVHKF